MTSKIELPKSKLRSALQSAAETSRWGAGNSAGERERERAVPLDSGPGPDSPYSGPEQSLISLTIFC